MGARRKGVGKRAPTSKRRAAQKTASIPASGVRAGAGARAGTSTGTGATPAPLASRAASEIARSLLRVYTLVEVRPQSVLEEAQVRGLRVETLADLRSVPLEKRDALATTFIKTAKIWATSNGASLGAAGVVTMAADVAALVAVNLRLVQHVCLSYGLTPAPERIDAWAILLGTLGEDVDFAAVRATPRGETNAVASRLLSETAKAFTRRLLKTGAGRAVPLVGAVFGGLSNYAFTVEVGTRARELFRALADEAARR
jgi:hypothetical protein